MKQKHWLLLFAVFSFVVVVFNEILFADVPELFQYGDKLGQVLSNLCLAFISSYIFYLVLVIPKEKRDKRNIYHSVYRLTKQLIGRADTVYELILNGSGVDAKKFDKESISKEDFIRLCSLVNRTDIVKGRELGIGNNATYAQFIHNDAYKHVSVYITQIFLFMPFLESDYVKLLNRIKETTFFLVADYILSPVFSNKTFSGWAGQLYDFLEIIRELENFNETKIKPYVK